MQAIEERATDLKAKFSTVSDIIVALQDIVSTQFHTHARLHIMMSIFFSSYVQKCPYVYSNMH
jgi:hypothetical protein